MSACGGGGGGGGGSGSSSSQSDASTPRSNTPVTPANPSPTPTTPQTDAPGLPVPSVDDDGYAPPKYTPSPDGWVFKQDALRFLNQSTFGATADDLAHVEEIGFEAWLDEQFATPRTGYNGFIYYSTSAPANCRTDSSVKGTPENICARDHYSLFDVQRQFFANAISGRDQLRQRVAFALSQIFVVSGNEITHAAGMAGYQNMLLDRAFGNYRDLLEDVTLSPVMGLYLDMINNAKGNPARNTQPNENYARESLQLFSIGLEALNLDGTAKRDAQGMPIPTYDQSVISEFARVYTGWTFAPVDGASSQWTNPSNLVAPMVAIDEQHDVGSKVLLDGVTLPPGRTAREDLDAALDVVFNHPNVGPFMAQRLIQHLVTSNPTPAFVARVASTFNDNGRGVRGDLKAVVRAILMDPEARGQRAQTADFGRLKDPALFITSFMRGLGGRSDGVFLRSQSSLMGQNIFTAPSVFNFYSPLNKIRGTDVLGPEFGIYDSNRSLLRAEFVYQLIYGGGAAPADNVIDSTGTSIDFTALAARSPDAVIDELDVLLTGASLSDAARQIVKNALSSPALTSRKARAQMALYLFGVSPQFQVVQ